MWLARLAWLATVVGGAAAVAAATGHHGAAARTVGTWAWWLLAGVVLVGVLVPSVATLTVLRATTPLTLVAAVVAWTAGAGPMRGAAAVAASAALVLVVFWAETGRAFVQASAYGHERRYPLRPPATFVAPMAVAWLVWAALVTIGVLATAGRRWLLGGLLLAAAAAAGRFAFVRWHEFTRRWLVLVPAGLVLHDAVVLSETLMVPWRQVTGHGLAVDGTQALDVSGPATGNLVEIRLVDMALVLVRNGREQPTALHVQSFLIAPSRPGRALAALRS